MLKNPEMGNNLFTQHAAFHYKYPTTMDTTLIGNTPKKNEDSYYYNEPYAENEFLIGGIHGLRQAAKSSGIYDPFNERFKTLLTHDKKESTYRRCGMVARTH